VQGNLASKMEKNGVDGRKKKVQETLLRTGGRPGERPIEHKKKEGATPRQRGGEQTKFGSQRLVREGEEGKSRYSIQTKARGGGRGNASRDYHLQHRNKGSKQW